MKNSIALIGFMGVGKTAVGKALAEKLNQKFVELDYLIEQKASKTIPQIFDEEGEITFRELEIEVTKEVAAQKNQIIACGGGIVLNQINIDRLKKNATIVCLTASPGVILKRVSNGGDRPVLKTINLPLIQELLKFRQPFYDRAADFKINTSRASINSIADRIISRIKPHEDFSL